MRLRRFFPITIAAVLMSAMAFGGAAFASDSFSADGVTVSDIISVPESLPGDGQAAVTIKVSVDKSRADGGLSAVTVQGSSVISSDTVDTVAIGDYANVSFVLQLTAAQLGSPVPLTLVWEGSGGMPFTVTIPVSSAEKPKVEFSRVTDKISVEKGGTVGLAYTVRNTGSMDIANLVITDEGVGPEMQLTEPVLAAGMAITKNYSYRVASDFASSPKLTYQVGGTTYTETCLPKQITLKNVELSATLGAILPDTVEPGQEVTLVCDLVNTGNVKLTNIAIGEPTLGENLFPAQQLDAGASIQFSRTVVLSATTKFRYVITAKDDSGKLYTVFSNLLEIAVDPGAGRYSIEIMASPDAIQLSEPGKVSFEITVTNKGPEPVANAVVRKGDGQPLKRYDTLPVGVSRFSYEEIIDKTTVFDFSVAVPVEQGEYVRSTGPLEIKVTWVPGVTDAEASPAPSFTDSVGTSGNKTGIGSLRDIVWAMIAVGALIAVTIVVLIVMIIREKLRNRKR